MFLLRSSENKANIQDSNLAFFILYTHNCDKLVALQLNSVRIETLNSIKYSELDT